MEQSTSLLQDLMASSPDLSAQTYFKSTLTALSHAIEDLVLEGDDCPLVIANFQQERFYVQESARYQRISERSDQVYVLAVPETELMQAPSSYATIALNPTDALAQEWHLVVVCDRYCATLVCQENREIDRSEILDTARKFQGFWTFDRAIGRKVARELLQRIERYRPDLRTRILGAQETYQLLQSNDSGNSGMDVNSQIDAQLFGTRLVEYLQTSQQEQLQAYVNVTQLNQQLTAIEQAQNNIIAIVGHELRTPLSTIRVCLESLVSEPDMPTIFQQAMLDTAMEDSERLRRLIQDFLLFSRLEGNSMTWHVEAIDLREIVLLMVSSFQGMGKTRSLPEVVLDLPVDPLMIVCDGEALQQLLSKLLDNAYKFTPSSGTVTIQARYCENNSDVHIQIADTGCGIESNRLEQIFDRFYQEEGFLRRSVGGAGLGLAICRRLAQNLGGKLWATSQGKGFGSEFHVWLPGAG